MIIGAGLAGMIAAHAFHGMQVYEAGARKEGHKALLRFRTEGVSHLTGVPFKKVRVHKGIWSSGGFHKPTIQLANHYAQKCLGHLRGGNRSIWNIESVDRYIAPEDFYDRLADQLGSRVHWESEIEDVRATTIISTAPMPVNMALAGLEVPELEFDRSPIFVQRIRLKQCELYQTVYFPDLELPLYRASITGDLLILEYTHQPDDKEREYCEWEVRRAFGITLRDPERLEGVSQSYGKIAPIDESLRRRVVSSLTDGKRIFSLGRFATWRNILLDDVVDDISVIKRLIDAGDYDRRIAAL